MKVHCLLILSAFIGLGVVQAQTVDNFTTYSQEDSSVTTSELKRVYRYVMRASVEEKTLVKAGLIVPLPLPFLEDRNKHGYGIVVGVEQKLTPSFSVQGLLIGRYDRTVLTGQHKVLEMPVSGRYYYSIRKRMRNGLSANNFSNNYFGIQLENILYGRKRSYSTTSAGNQTVIYSDKTIVSRFDMLNATSLQWGMQRRLGSKGYLDFNLSLAVLPILMQQRVPDFIIPIKINVNLGLGW